MVNTVARNKLNILLDTTLMQKVRALQDTIEKRRTEDFMNYIEGNMITNCDIMRKRRRNIWAHFKNTQGQEHKTPNKTCTYFVAMYLEI